ncbi:aspartate aminotransferase [Acetobacter estunensis NRIC 0472]|uniref:Aminotransferase n=1 Tax=Acetobacter estunensis TaxID=104097 RepID=A0A967B4B9_9PROT|nr:pyridoxal phosphate-dependent aminotransferase [Acetobacter estunensis]NHO53510.1 aminotransferase class I/II-fold pyridoxal phosphate-dependent enzyme [Acetobacter estunensis]GBQ28858.1 aspartate aminotransferase [Acetobacter estunensis NRIC 0472]
MTGPTLAHRLDGLPAPATIEMSRQARALKAQGHDIISLALGEPDFATPEDAVEAAHQAALRGETKYPPVDGTPALKAAIARKFERDNGLTFAPDELMVSNGGKQVIFNAFMATIDPGDEVVVPAPYWVSYPLIARMFGGVPVHPVCDEADGFSLRPERLAAAMTPRTKWVVLNFPNNPTGGLCSESDLRGIAEVLRKWPDVWILSDEIYEHLVFDEHRFASFAAIAPDLRNRIVTMNGMAKAYAMTGWRVGFAGGPKRLIAAMRSVQSNATSGICTVAQAAAAAALDGPQDMIRDMVTTYERRRNLMVQALRDIPGLSCAIPAGAFYVYPGVTGCLGKTTPAGRKLVTDTDFAMAFLEEAYVATVPGSAFGLAPYLRLSCATSNTLLIEACQRLRHFVASLA